MKNIERLRSGDMDALGTIYDLHYDAFEESICKTFRISTREAGSLFNEVLIKLHRNVMNGGFQEERDGGLRGWLFTTGKHIHLGMLNKDRRMPGAREDPEIALLKISDDDSGKYDPEIDTLERRIIETLESMPNACRQLLRLFYLEGKSLKEISEILGKTYKATKKDRWLCLQNLKKKFNP